MGAPSILKFIIKFIKFTSLNKPDATKTAE